MFLQQKLDLKKKPVIIVCGIVMSYFFLPKSALFSCRPSFDVGTVMNIPYYYILYISRITFQTQEKTRVWESLSRGCGIIASYMKA